jgi:hypothetical protein
LLKVANSQETKSGAIDWEMKADIHSRLGFPEEILNKRPDIYIYIYIYMSKKAVIIIVLTISWEESIESAYE